MNSYTFFTVIQKIFSSKLFAYIFVVVAILQIWWHLMPLIQSGLIDFQVYLTAVRSVEKHTNPYVSSNTAMSFLYPPGSLFFFLPFGLLDSVVAGTAMSMLSIICFFGSVYLCFKVFRSTFSIVEWLLVSSLLLQTFPVKFTLAMGQINIIILFFCTASLFLYSKHMKLFSGISLGIAAVLKIYPLILIPLFILKKEWKLLFSFLFSFLVWNLFFYDYLSSYFFFNLPQLISSVPMSLPSFYDQSVPAFLYRIGFSENIISVLQPLIIGIILVFSFWKTQKWKLIESAVVLLSLAVILHAPAWQHQLVLVYPLLFLIYPKKIWWLFWLLFVVHYPYESNFLVSFPIFAAIHTMAVVTLLIIVFYFHKKAPIIS